MSCRSEFVMPIEKITAEIVYFKELGTYQWVCRDHADEDNKYNGAGDTIVEAIEDMIRRKKDYYLPMFDDGMLF